MTAVDFLLICLGIAAIVIAGAWAFKLITEVRARNRMFKEVAEMTPETAFNMRYQHLRDQRFARPMAPPQPDPNRNLPRRVVLPFPTRKKSDDDK